ncbi:MAG: hypothetical protein HS118_11355 [Bacteroidia bacterium]|nr:hypothetical protein [Bacteroidia bacterium]
MILPLTELTILTTIQPAWYGIQMRENNVFATVRYNVTNNTIHLNNGTYGIYSGMLNRQILNLMSYALQETDTA